MLMSRSTDPRLPVRIVPAGTALPPDGLVLRGASPQGRRHLTGCGCCAPRSLVSQALSAAWLARARACTPLSAELVVATEDAASVRAALAGDALLRARFRLADGGPIAATA